jgi:hypothetical protein
MIRYYGVSTKAISAGIKVFDCSPNKEFSAEFSAELSVVPLFNVSHATMCAL